MMRELRIHTHRTESVQCHTWRWKIIAK